MADLKRFREKVTICRKRQRTAEGRQYTLEDLGKAIGLSADELGRRLRGNGKQPLSQDQIFAIVRALAEWETLSWDEAMDLLVMMDSPLDLAGWQTDLQRFLGPLPRSAQQARTSRMTSAGEKPPSLAHQIFQAPDRPKDYVPRSTLLNDLKGLLLTPENHQPTAITTALRGAGGFGKTTLASAICHDEEIRAAFPDGILWVELGEHPPRPLDVLNRLLRVLEPFEREALTLEEARERWRKALEAHAYLLVIDDVWRMEALEELLRDGPRCQRLITTRNDQLLPEDATRVWVDAMEPAEAMALLCEGVIDDWPHTLEPSALEQVVIQQLGCWPLLMSLARGMLKNQVRLGKTPEQALAQVKHAYEARGMATFHMGDRDERQRNVDACLEVNLRQLEEWVPVHSQARQRYLELAVFPEDMDIPLSTLQIYWKGTGGLHEYEVEELCLHLADLSLLLPWNTESLTIRLHDVVRSYLIQRAGKHLPTLHQRLLDAHQQHYHLTRWADLPQSEAYLWQRLISHLCQSDQSGGLQTTLTDLLYLTRKVVYVGVSTLEADLGLASTFSFQEDGYPSSLLTRLHRTIMRHHHLLHQISSEAEIGGLLLSYLYEEESLTVQRFVLEQVLPRPFLTAWHPLSRASSATLIRTLRGHTNSVSACGFSPDGQQIVSGSDDHTIKLWDNRMGTELLTLTGHTNVVNACGFNPDGKWIVSGSDDHTIKLWDSRMGAELLTLTGHTGSVNACGFNPDGKWIVSASDDFTRKLWDSTTGGELFTLSGHVGPVTACGFNPDGKRIVSASLDQTLKLWDSTTGGESLTLSGHTLPVTACRFSPDGKRVVSSSTDQTLKLWDSTTGEELLTLVGHTSPVFACGFSPDGSKIVSASADQTLKLWDSTTGGELLTLSGHTGQVRACGFSPDGSKIVAISYDQDPKVWEAATRGELLTLSGHTGPVRACGFSPDGKWIVSASDDDTLRVWDSRTGAELLVLSAHTSWITACGFSPDGSKIVSSCGEELKVWDSRTGKKLLTISATAEVTYSLNGTRLITAFLVFACGFSPDGRWIVSASGDKTLKLWDAVTGGELLTLTGHTDAVLACGFSPDGKWIVSASNDRTLRVWEAQSGKCVLTYPVDGALTGYAFHPDGEHLVACGDAGIYWLRLVQ